MAEAITLTMEGMLLNWLKEVGDEVKSGEVVAEIEADKATVEVEAPADGVLLEINAQVGEELAEGAVIGSIGASGEDPADSSSGNGASAPQESSRDTQTETVTATATNDANGSSGAQVAATTPDGRVKISPIARRMAEDKGYDIGQIPGSGPGGRIVKVDVEQFTPGAAPAKPAQPAAQPAAAAPKSAAMAEARQTYGKLPSGADVEIEDISRMRSRIAESTITSTMMTPHFYVTAQMDVAALLELRKEINTKLEAEGIKVSVNDMVVKATALTLTKFPNLNAHYYGDKIVRNKRFNIGIAVALPNNGLVNVVSHDVDVTPLSVLAPRHKEMFARAREGRVKPEDLKGATFTVSNLGPYNVDHFSAIISPPEAGIIAVGSAKKIPVVLEDGTLGVGNRMSVTISVDHRISDGAEGAEFLQTFRTYIEDPIRLLV